MNKAVLWGARLCDRISFFFLKPLVRTLWKRRVSPDQRISMFAFLNHSVRLCPWRVYLGFILRMLFSPHVLSQFVPHLFYLLKFLFQSIHFSWLPFPSFLLCLSLARNHLLLLGFSILWSNGLSGGVSAWWTILLSLYFFCLSPSLSLIPFVCFIQFSYMSYFYIQNPLLPHLPFFLKHIFFHLCLTVNVRSFLSLVLPIPSSLLLNW